jgi:hypothetical protein
MVLSNAPRYYEEEDDLELTVEEYEEVRVFWWIFTGLALAALHVPFLFRIGV